MVGRMTKIRDLSDTERKVVRKYLARRDAARAEALLCEEILGDLAHAFAGRDGPTTMTEDALYEPEVDGGS